MERMVMLARHGQSVANALREEDPAESRIQGAGLPELLTLRGEQQGRASGLALGRFIAEHNVQLDAIHSSDATRALHTRDLAMEAGNIAAPCYESDARLRELCKGELEGRLRREVYIGPDESNDWHYRYGSIERGGETPFEAGTRWLDWFRYATHPDVLPARSTIIAFGHNGVTAYGLWLLTNPDKVPGGPGDYDETKQFRVDNGETLVLAEQEDIWYVAGKIAPTKQDFRIAKGELL